MFRFLLLVCLTFLSAFSFAQETAAGFFHNGNSKKGNIFITWGYNRAYYNHSDIHFKGDGYDFSLSRVQAVDMPEKFAAKVYFNPKWLSVPQYNFRVGYYFRENTALSIGTDHMKYHFVQTQQVLIDGYIDPEKYDMPGYTGTFNGSNFLYNPDFMDFHHSDGFNFLRLALEQRVPVYQSRNGNHLVALNGSVSLGALIPWTDFTFFGQNYRNRLHLSGYGTSAHLGLRYEFHKYFFLQIAAQLGWTNLPDIMLEDDLPSRASQQIVFFERSWALGGYIPVKRQKKGMQE